MSEIRLNVLDGTRAIHGTTHGSQVDLLVAALSAEPETIEELELALARFIRPRPGHGFFAGFRAGTDDEPWDAGICVIDLAARLVAIDSTYSLPGPQGHVEYRNENGLTDVGLSYHLSEEWLFTYDVESWQWRVEERRRERSALPPLDVRSVLYGQVCEFVARECLSTVSAHPEIRATTDEAAADETADLVRSIHARWLTTPRDDLRGQTPRDVLLARRDHIGWDMQDRSEQWSQLRECPPGLPRESAAFRYGGFGTHEIVVYYDLVRHLTWECWDRITAEPSRQAADDLIAWLAEERDRWLETPNFEDFSGHTPADVIERERLRLPMGVSGREAMVDPDCPCCQMMAEDMRPYFWCLDGSHMDDDFAFSFHRTREEWEAEQRKWEEFNRRFEEERAQRRTADERSASIWKTSYSAEDADDLVGLPPEVALFGIGAHLGELTQDLGEFAEGEAFIAALHRDFSNLRETADDLSAALVHPVVERFSQTLETIAETRPDLADKCQDLDRKLHELATRLADAPAWDDELPF